MLKEAIDKIVSLATPKIFTIDGDNYTNDTDMRRVAPHVDRPSKMGFTSLNGVVQAIQTEIGREEVTKPLFVNIESHEDVRVFTTYRHDNLDRDLLYVASPDLPAKFAEWSNHEDAIIMLRSRFIPNEGTEYLLDLLARISNEDSVTSEDNGVSQKVSASMGVALKSFEQVKPRVALAPFRTFLEVQQPESEFLLRIKPGDKETGTQPKVGLIEADGGAWKLVAKHNIADYFREHLAELIGEGLVVVAE
jgi:hypothetical protein